MTHSEASFLLVPRCIVVVTSQMVDGSSADDMPWFRALGICDILVLGSLKALHGTLSTDSSSAVGPPESYCQIVLLSEARLAVLQPQPAVVYFPTLSSCKADPLLASGLQWNTKVYSLRHQQNLPRPAKITLLFILKYLLQFGIKI